MKVLTYHKFLPSSFFEEQIKYIVNNYQVGCGNLDDPYYKDQLIITADDGDISFYQIAFPILKKYKLPAILFVITDLINTQKPFWWDEIEYYLGKKQGSRKVWEIKKWTNKKREVYLKELRNSSSKAPLKQPQLTTRQLCEMQDAGIIIGNHSHTHPMFDQCTKEELEIEMNYSTIKLKNLGFNPNIFAYPNGNYSLESEEILKDFGITMAYLFDHKINNSNGDPLRISRLIVNDDIPLWKFKFILSGWHSKILPITKFMGKIKASLNK